jgi:hypothetical protein
VASQSASVELAKIIRTAMAAQKPNGRRLMAGVSAGFTVAMPPFFPHLKLSHQKIAISLWNEKVLPGKDIKIGLKGKR